MTQKVEAWLRGPVDRVPAHLQPVAHGLLHYSEEMIDAIDGLTPEQLLARPGGAASIAYHVHHALGSLGRLFTYARGEALSAEQMRALVAEKEANERTVEAAELRARIRDAVEDAIRELESIDEGVLLAYRPVGRAKLPSTVIGLLSHAADHMARHTGQVVTTARVIKGG